MVDIGPHLAGIRRGAQRYSSTFLIVFEMTGWVGTLVLDWMEKERVIAARLVAVQWS